MDLLRGKVGQEGLQTGDLGETVRANAVMHRHQGAAAQHLRHLRGAVTVYGEEAAHGNEKHITFADFGDLLRGELVSQVTQMSHRDTAGFDDMDGVGASQRTAIIVVERGHCADGEGTLPFGKHCNGLDVVVVEVVMGRESLGRGLGRTKKAAEQQAAYQALLLLRDKGYVFKKY